jgi:hypothetical protein
MLIDSDVGNVLLGVIAAAIAGFLAYLGRVFVLPWLQARFQAEVTLTGVWTGTQTSARGIFGFKFDLRQSGNKIHGTFFANDDVGGRRLSRTHILRGEVHHGHVTLTYRNANSRSVGLGSFLFAVRQGGEKLVGNMLFLQTGTGQIGSSSDLVLERQ